MFRKSTKFITLLLLISLTSLGVWFALRSPSSAGQSTSSVQTKAAKRGPFKWYVSATGIVEPKYVTEIRSKASGEIKKVAVDVGAKVKKGQLLVQLAPLVEQRRLNKSKAELSIARANYLKASRVHSYIKSKFKTSERLAKKGLVSRESHDALKHEVRLKSAERSIALAQVRRAKEEVNEAKDRLKDTEIRAPEDGVILQRLVQPGQIIFSGTNSASGGTMLFRMANLEQLYVRGDVDESDVVRVRQGAFVKVTIDALPGRSFRGTIVRVNPEGRSQNNVTVFEILVRLEREAAKVMKVQMTTNLKVLVTQKDDALVIPSIAIRRRGRRTGVFIKKGSQIRFRRIKVGDSNGTETIVTKGLSEGTHVVTSLLRRGSGKKRRSSRRRKGSSMRNMRRMMR